MNTFFFPRRTLAVLAAGLLAAGAAMAQDVDAEQRLARYQQVAGEPVLSFRLFGALNHWEALDHSHVVVWARPNEAWMLTLDAPCPDLSKARAIELGDAGGRVLARSSVVTVIGDVASLPCRVESIQPLDARALKELDDQDADGSGGT